MNTLFFPVFCWIINGDKMQLCDYFGILVGFGGMILVVQPYKQQESL